MQYAPAHELENPRVGRRLRFVSLRLWHSLCPNRNANNAANQKGKACNNSSDDWDQARLMRCESGLNKCSKDDQDHLDAYAQCLSKLDTCVDGQSLSWGLQRLGCIEPITKLSFECANAIK